MIVSRTPVRVSFFGGGTDYPDWYREHGGAVLATTIDKYCYISVRELPPVFDRRFRIVCSMVEDVKEIREITHPAVRGILEWLGVTTSLEIHHEGDVPARSGLGSSSAFTVGLIGAMHALARCRVSKDALAREAIHVEQSVLREPVGLQDQISAAFGGFNHVLLRQDGTYDVRPIVVPPERLETLQDHLMLVFTGISHTNAEVAQAVISNLNSRVDELTAMRRMVDDGIEILSSPTTDIAEFGRLLDRTWALKRRLSEGVSSPVIDNAYEVARRAGAVGGKLLGAGGGGFMLFFVRAEDRARVRHALDGLLEVPFRFERSGSRIVLDQPGGGESGS